MPTLVIEMGHCYRTSGATGTTGEQDYATRVANRAIELLHGRSGWSVHKKLADTNDYAGNAFVAIHCDGSINPDARGASIGYRNAAGQVFGQAVMRVYAARGWPGGFRPDNYTSNLRNYYGHGEAIAAGNTRAFIMECGFLTNSSDRAALTSLEGVDRVVLSIGDALGITSEVDMAGEIADRIFRDMEGKLGALPVGSYYRGKAAYDVLIDAAGWGHHNSVKLDALAGALTNDEVNVIAAVREIVAADQDNEVVVGPEHIDALVAAFVNATPAPITPEVIETSLRRVFADAGSTEETPTA